MKYIFTFLSIVVLATSLKAQTEVMAWGNLTGIRIQGELMEFETSFRVVETNWSAIDFTGRERQPTRFDRTTSIATIHSSVRQISFEQTVEDKAEGTAAVSLSFQSDTACKVQGVYYCVELPAKHYATGTVTIANRQIVAEASGRTVKIEFSSKIHAFLREEAGNTVVYIQLFGGNLKKGSKGRIHFTITVSGHIDHSPVEVAIERNRPGRLFEGFGGNFRLQNPVTDPQVIDYCLQNMRIAYGRVEMPWEAWHPDEADDPLTLARHGQVNERVHRSMQMAQRLAAMGIPVIVAVWFPPEWALAPNQQRPIQSGGVAALRLDPTKKEQIYKSLSDYLVCLKQQYGVEAHSFSFNESDIGIDIFHTPREHAGFIQEFGAYIAARGLATKMLLGDNSDATTFDFILPVLHNPEIHKYVAAISFHSWRGCDDQTLKKWANAAQQLNVPLIICEGSTDAAAWRYPHIFLEPAFALHEINLYTRILSICQPLSILQWQLTADYSPLTGAGIFGSDGPLRPTQRFWNLKQLSDTPPQSFALPFTCNKEEVNCAAFGNIATNEYAVHLVNNGAQRSASIKGLPIDCNNIKAFVTNGSLSMLEVGTSKMEDGTIIVELPSASFISVFANY